MGLLAGKREFQPPQALTVGDDADFLFLGLQDRALLDMVFVIGVHLAGAHVFVADPADALQFVAEALALLVLAAIGIVEGQFAGEHAGCHHRRRKARAFLIGPVGDDDRVSGLDVEIVQRAHQFERGQHAEHAVILAARRLGVEMTADIDGQRVGIGAGARHEHRAHLVDAHRKPRRVAPLLEERAPFGIGIRQRLAVVAARDAGSDLRHFHQRVPKAVAIDPHVFACRHCCSPVAPFRRLSCF